MKMIETDSDETDFIEIISIIWQSFLDANFELQRRSEAQNLVVCVLVSLMVDLQSFHFKL